MLGSRFDLAETLVEIAQRGPAGAVLPAGAMSEVETAARSGNFGDHCVELERQMAEVARLVHLNHPRLSFKCPICDSRMQVSCETVLSEFGTLDVRNHELDCATCGLTTLRAFHSSIGYQELPR